MISLLKSATRQSRSSSHHQQHCASPSCAAAPTDLTLAAMLQRLEQAVMPVWSLQDYVAVNPWAGLAGHSFEHVRRQLREVSDCQMLMPLDYYRALYANREFSRSDVNAAVKECLGSAAAAKQTDLENRIISMLEAEQAEGEASRHPGPARMRTIAELASEISELDWAQWIQAELTKFCAAHFDRGQAIWKPSTRGQELWMAWQRFAAVDRNPQVWGLKDFAAIATQLSERPVEALQTLLEALQVPESQRERFLLCELLSAPGWFAWIRRSSWNRDVSGGSPDFAALLAIRLVYELALARMLNLSLDWIGNPDQTNAHEGAGANSEMDTEEEQQRAVLLRASELAFRSQLLEKLSQNLEPVRLGAAEAQMVFCIDVRSERLRRAIESLAPQIQTKGFAGFFGIPCEYRTWGAELTGTRENISQLPVLLQPLMVVQEELQEVSDEEAAEALARRKQVRVSRAIWKRFQASLTSCFPSVETTGWLGGWKLLQQSFLLNRPSATAGSRVDGLLADEQRLLGPGLRGLNSQGWSTTRLADLAESILKNMGLSDGFARLVVLCGHRSEVANNPLQASLDCGACGGHSGEANARFAALLLNQEFIRSELRQRGLEIPSDTLFLAAVHQTTSDELEFPDHDNVPLSHARELMRLRDLCRRAGRQVAEERGMQLNLGTIEEIQQRSADWSEVRPEWGLAGNAAFIAGPRELTRGLDLGGRSFLHDYDFRADESGKALELILTAPLVVASWINLQYYASSVDNRRYGSGCKTIHNVVGKFGILSGSESDLQTGLPWQSVGLGQHLQHQPLRLQAIVAAPRAMVERIIAGHQHLRDLLQGRWIHLGVIENGQVWSWQSGGTWQLLSAGGATSDSCVSELVMS